MTDPTISEDNGYPAQVARARIADATAQALIQLEQTSDCVAILNPQQEQLWAMAQEALHRLYAAVSAG